MSRIVYSRPFEGFDQSVWPEMTAWLCDHIVRLETAFSDPLSRLNREIKSGIDSTTADAYGAPQGGSLPQTEGGAIGAAGQPSDRLAG